MRVAFFGTSDFAVPTLRALLAAGHEVAVVVTQPDRPAGRARQLTPSPVKRAAEELGLGVLQPERASSPEAIADLAQFSPELLVVAAYGQMLSAALLAVPRWGGINVHASLLPKYRGAAPVQRAIMAGEEETGVTIMWMTPRLDAGDIILQERTAIAPGETAGELLERLAEVGARLLVEALALVAAGRAPRRPQAEGEVTLAPALRKEERLVDWGESAEQVVRRVRALAPRPGAVTRHRGKQVKLIRASIVQIGGGQAGAPGEIVEVGPRGVVVRAGKGLVVVEEVQPEGGRAMSAAEYARGHRAGPGEALS